MEIHNFYMDLVLSLRYLYGSLIFPEDTFKRFQTNLGTRVAQIDYNPKFELPALIVNFVDSRPVAYRPLVFQRTPLNNESIIPVLYNRSKDLTLNLQEEHFEMQFEVFINVESQGQALEIKSQLEDYMPVGKYFLLYKYITFFEIEQKYLQPYLFDIHNDDIVNLFTKFNRYKNRIEFCFSNMYEPLVRLDSCSVQIGSTDQRSFQVVCNHTILIPKPVYLFIPPEEIPQISGMNSRLIQDLTILTGEGYILLVTAKDTNGNLFKKNVRVIPNSEYEFDQDFTIGIVNANVTGVVKSLKKKITAKIRLPNNEKNKITTFVCDAEIVTSLNPDLMDDITQPITIKLTGDLTGTVYNPIILDNTFTGLFKGYIHDIYSIEDVSAEFVLIKQWYEYANVVVKTISPRNILYNYGWYSLPFLTTMPIELNNKNLQIDLLNSKIKLIGINDTCGVHEIPTNITFDRVGNFTSTFTFIDCEGRSILATVIGKLDANGNLIYDIVFEPDYGFSVLYFVLDLAYSNLRYGARYIERINIKIHEESSIISVDPDITLYKDMFDNETRIDNRKLLRTYVFNNVDDDSIIFDEINQQVQLVINLDYEFDYDYLVSQGKTLYWRFVFDSHIFDEDHTSDIVLDTRGSTPGYKLIFNCGRRFFETYFSGYSLVNPIYFQLYELL